jgi:hypothetical protein
MLLELLYDGIRSGIDPAHMAVVGPAHEEGSSAVSPDLEDFAVACSRADGVAPNDETVSRSSVKTERRRGS